MTFFYDLNKKLNTIRELPETTHQQLNERDMSRAAKGHEKYGKEGMQALAKAGREGKDLDRVRDKYNKYDESVDEGMHSQDAMTLNPDFRKKEPTGIMGKIARGAKKVADFVAPGDEDLMRDLERKSGGKRPVNENREGPADLLAAVEEEIARPGRSTDNLRDVLNATFGSDRSPEFKKARAVIEKYLDLVDNASVGSSNDGIAPMRGGNIARFIQDYDLVDRLQHASAMLDKIVGMREATTPMTPKQKSFAKLAPPADKITFADKIAGAKKEVDEMLGDVAAEAMKAALGKGKQPVQGMGEATKEIPGGRRHTSEPGGYGRRDDDDAPKAATKKGRGRPRKGSDSETGEVMKPDWSAFGVGGKVNLPKHKGAVTKHKMVGEGDDADVEAAVKLLKKAGYTVTKGDAEQVDEKAVSKKQQKFMGMVHAAKKGDKPASPEVARAAKGMSGKEAEKFASTKHKGLPEKKKKTDETTVAGNVATAESSDAPKEKKSKSSGGMNFGGSIYDSVNHDLEAMIAESMQRLDESMSINMSMNSDAPDGNGKSLTVTATGDDADQLASMLQMAGMNSTGPSPEEAYAEAPCQVDENQPDWPTETEYSDDAFQYSGGLNKPKRDVAGDGQATGTVTAVHATDDTDNEELRRMMEMAGVKKKTVDEEKTEEGNKFTGNLAKARAAGKKEADLDGDGDMEPVKESIFDLQRLWKAYKG